MLLVNDTYFQTDVYLSNFFQQLPTDTPSDQLAHITQNIN